MILLNKMLFFKYILFYLPIIILYPENWLHIKIYTNQQLVYVVHKATTNPSNLGEEETY